EGWGLWCYLKEFGTFCFDIAARRSRSSRSCMPVRALLAVRWISAFAGVTEGSCRRQKLTGAPSRPRQGDGEARAGDAAIVVGAVAGDDLAAMRLDDLLGD